MYTIRTTVDYQSDTLLATADRDHAIQVGLLLAASKAYAQIEVEDPQHNVIWATYPPTAADKETWGSFNSPALPTPPLSPSMRTDLETGEEIPPPLSDFDPAV